MRGTHRLYLARERGLCVFTNRHSRLVRSPRRSSPRITASSWTVEILHSSETCLAAQMTHCTVDFNSGKGVCRDKHDDKTIRAITINGQSRRAWNKRTSHTAWFEHVEHIEAGGNTQNGRHGISGYQRRGSHRRYDSHMIVFLQQIQTATSSHRIHRHKLPSYRVPASAITAPPKSAQHNPHHPSQNNRHKGIN